MGFWVCSPLPSLLPVPQPGSDSFVSVIYYFSFFFFHFLFFVFFGGFEFGEGERRLPPPNPNSSAASSVVTAPLPCLSEDLSCHFAQWGVVRATHGLPAYGPRCTGGVLARTHWGDDSSRVMSHQSANPLWLCRASGHGRDRGRELSCGLVMWTSFIHALFKHDTLLVKRSAMSALCWQSLSCSKPCAVWRPPHRAVTKKHQ